ncbi:MAG: hypothetical protein CR989_04935 [Flavobacteriales bacterium]|nr:MAG: hypothetical protein CR989_04935 [Flavobacteriales bacterium]
MSETILYATDLSKNAGEVLKYAYHLSNSFDKTLTILHIYQMPHIRFMVSRPKEQMKLMAIEEQKAVVKHYCSKHLADNFTDKRIKIKVLIEDNVLDGIVKVAKKLSPFMVLIGRKDKQTERGLLAGHIGKGLFTDLEVPVVIVPHKIKDIRSKNLIYATDFEEGDFFALKELIEMAKVADANIHVVHISTKDEQKGNEAMRAFKKRLLSETDYDRIRFFVLPCNNIKKKLKSYSKEINADLIALLTREEPGFFKQLFSRSLAEKLEVDIPIPLMSFNDAS